LQWLSEMFESVDPNCPKCGSRVRDCVSEFFFSRHELPSLETASAKITGHKCGCGHKFVVVAYVFDERSQATELAAKPPIVTV
jgi:hypothetical protein